MNPIPPSSKRFLLRCLAASFILHGLAAIFSAGFFHADEHFQILEFLGFKLGMTEVSHLPLEFGEKMRPWMESALLFLTSRMGETLGMAPVRSAPFLWATIFRALSAAFGWLSVAALAWTSRSWFRTERLWRTAVLAMTFLWCIPAFHARLSSENWGATFFVLGLTLFLEVERKGGVAALCGTGLAGALLGMSFEFRYQVAFLIIGFFAWLVLVHRTSGRKLALLMAGALCAVTAGFWIDRWGYGQWVNAPWNYIDFNLIRGRVSAVDTDPWWDLFRRAWTESWPLLGFLALLSFPIAWIAQPRSVFTWCTLPFFLVHALIGHKELRFLFPLLPFAGIALVHAADGIARKFPSLTIRNRASRWIITSLVIWNGVALIVTSLSPAWMPIRFLEGLWTLQSHRDNAPLVLHWKDKNPLDASGSAISFYRPEGITLEQIQDDAAASAGIDASVGPYWLFYDGFDLGRASSELRLKCSLEVQAFPAWVSTLASEMHLLRFFSHVTNYSLYRCEKRHS